MAMQHRAYVFDHDGFEAELRPLLEDALRSDDTAGLRRFIAEHFAELKDPYAGEPLDDGWECLLEHEDVQELGDFALTRYYDPADDIGLGADWPAVQELLVDRLARGTVFTLGHVVGAGGRPFDPGAMGSYFMTNDEAAARLEALEDGDPTGLERAAAMFRAIVDSGKGAYMTF